MTGTLKVVSQRRIKKLIRGELLKTRSVQLVEEIARSTINMQTCPRSQAGGA